VRCPFSLDSDPDGRPPRRSPSSTSISSARSANVCSARSHRHSCKNAALRVRSSPLLADVERASQKSYAERNRFSRNCATLRTRRAKRSRLKACAPPSQLLLSVGLNNTQPLFELKAGNRARLDPLGLHYSVPPPDTTLPGIHLSTPRAEWAALFLALEQNACPSLAVDRRLVRKTSSLATFYNTTGEIARVAEVRKHSTR